MVFLAFLSRKSYSETIVHILRLQNGLMWPSLHSLHVDLPLAESMMRMNKDKHRHICVPEVKPWIFSLANFLILFFSQEVYD